MLIMQPRKLLMISTDRKIFEEGSSVRARQMEYAKNWDEVHIIVFDTTKNIETVIASNCWAYSTKSWTKFMYPFDAIRLGKFIIEKRGITDITCQDSSLTAMAGVSLKKQFQGKSATAISLEIQIHEDIGSPNFAYNISNKIRKILSLSYLPKADHIRVVSNRIKKFLVDTLGINDSLIEVRPIMVDIEKVKNTPILPGADLHKKYPQFQKVVLMASRLEREKNIELAIRAWKEVIKMIPKAGLIIVGRGSQSQKLQAQSRNLGLTQNIVFEPWADYSTLISYYKSADLFLNTSLFEGYGMTLAEAKAAGCKIVSTDVGVAREAGAKIVGWEKGEVAESIVKMW
ncbi:MAG: hypothetical protein RL536_532, partial [Candidatus Parcubacteria bacterium]